MTEEEAKARFEELIKEHERDLAVGRFKGVSEEKTKDYIDEIFRALGWDIKHDTEKEVLTGRRKRVDYSFHISGFTKFLLEAKAYDVELTDKEVKQALGYAYQNYKKWVVLSNYKEIRIYNCQYYNKSEEIRRLVTPIKISELINRFKDLWLLSRPGCEQNLIEEYAARMSKAKIKEPIDALAEDMLRWREILSKEMREHSRLNEISGKDKEAAKEWIDEAVQMLLNRFVFLRTVEDFGNDKASLRHLTRQWEGSKKRPLMTDMSLFFRKIEEIYNSGLFEKHPCEDLTLRNDALLTVINEMYDSREHDLEWDFSVLTKNQDVLGLAYEQYLGTVLTETARVKESKKKRKKMGIYYTPKYVVDYIVENTLDELLKKTKNENVTKIKILDPACGSGSFLKQAYRKLSKEIADRGLDKQQYILGYASEDNFTVYDVALKNCIKGVDLDKKAVEMAKLNMLLVGAEKGVHRLPDLDLSIRQGNSLIDNFEIAGKNAFKWEKEFKQIMDEGRFDVVIGNPPYVSFGIGRTGKLSKEYQSYFYSKFPNSAEYKISTYSLFIELAIMLSRQDGKIGLILPDSFLVGRYFSKIRKYILGTCLIKKIILFENDFWESGAVGFPVIIILQKNNNATARKRNKVEIISCATPENLSREKYLSVLCEQAVFERSFRNRFRLIFDKEKIKILEKIDLNATPLEAYVDFHHGIRSKVGRDKIISKKNEGKNWAKGLIHSNEINRYSLKYEGNFVLINPEYLFSGGWDKRLIEQEKILVRRTGDKLIATIDNSGFYHTNALIYGIKKRALQLKLILGLLNSKLINFYYQQTTMKKGRLFPQVEIDTINQLPIKESERFCKSITHVVEELLDLNKRLNEIGDKKTDRKGIEEEIKKMDTDIDELVYQLYGITEEEKKIIEESLK